MQHYSKILVTGGAGFIGSHIVDRLVAENIEVFVLDNLQTGRLENISQHATRKNFHFIHGDIRDFELVGNIVRNVDAIIHLAALASVPESIKNPIPTSDVNVQGTLNLLDASAKYNVKRFVYASSSAVYGDTAEIPVKEDSPLMPASPYGVSKLAAENYVRVFHEVFGLETVCLRYFNVYGPRQAYSEYSGVITQFMNRLARNLPLMIFGDGEQSRDFVHVKDTVEANALVLRNNGISGETFNIATGEGTTINEVARMLLEAANKTSLEIIHSNARRGDVRHSVADISKAKQKLTYNPRIAFKEELKIIIDNYAIES